MALRLASSLCASAALAVLAALALPARGEGAAPAAASAPALAADAGVPAPAADAGVSAPAARSPASPPRRLPHAFVEACAHGAAQYAARDFSGATETFRRAMELAPQAPIGPYLLGEALFAAGDTAGAEEAWARARVASEDDPAMHGRVLFVVAQAKERQKKWDEANAAWEAYRSWATRFPQAAPFAANAAARVAAIDKRMAQDRAAEIVRKRIVETQDGGVFSDPKAEPPKP
jgi:hypothetical protein